MSVFRILYRGSLSSCNYSCDYCPFAKTANSREELQRDAAELQRFVDWVANTKRPLGILFTPWGEALIHAHYRRALVRLSQMPHVQRVALQTNLSCNVTDLSQAYRESLALWATYHPTQTSIERFVQRCQSLDCLGIRYSVGVVGLREHFNDITELRRRLPDQIYLWVNSYKRIAGYYSDADLQFLRSVDPYFDLNRHDYASRGKACQAGNSVLSVTGDGEVRRCHFIEDTLGNIYRDDIFQRLGPTACSRTSCGCHIGYVHRPELRLYQLFGDNVLERIPATWPSIEAEYTRSGLVGEG